MPAKFDQNESIYNRDTFKGHCSLFLAFDLKDRETNHHRWPMSCLSAKFEQNQSITAMENFILQGSTTSQLTAIQLEGVLCSTVHEIGSEMMFC